VKKKTIYISGPMTGLPEFNFPAFHAKEKELREQGHKVKNPASNGSDATKSWLDYIIDDLILLKECTHIHFLDGWESSPGARIEAACAERMELEVHP